MEKLKKQSSTLKTRLNFEFLLDRTSAAIKAVQVNCMMMPPSMLHYSIVSNKVSISDVKNFYSCCKEEEFNPF